MNRQFWKGAGVKLIENLLSIKVWTIFALLISTAILTWFDKMSGDAFAAVNGGVISTVYALREGFKITKVKALKDKDPDHIKEIKV